MDVRIGSIDATVVDSGSGATDSAQIERIARRVLAMIRQNEMREQRGKEDRQVSSPDDQDIEDYG
jgi:hypothetical protein